MNDPKNKLAPFSKVLEKIEIHIQVTSKRYRTVYQLFDFYSRGFKVHLLLLLFFSVLLGIMETFQIVLLYPILNASFDLKGSGLSFFDPLYSFVLTHVVFPEVVAFCLLFMGFVVMTFLVTIVYHGLSLMFTRNVIVKTKGLIFKKLKNSDYRYFVDNKQGDVLYNVVSAPSSISGFLDSSTILFSNIVVIFTVFIALFFISPLGMVILLGGGIVFIILVREVGNRVSYSIGAVQMRSVSSENTIISQYIQGIRQIRSVHGDDFWESQYTKTLRTYWDKYVRYRFTERLPSSLLMMVFFIGIAMMVIILYYLYADRFLSIIPLIGTFAFSALKLLPRLTSFSSLNSVMLNAYPSLEKIYFLLNDDRYETIQNGSTPFTSLESDIIFDDVEFRYYNEQELIEHLNLTIHKNRVTALVGHSGSGKSTVISLLLRYYDVSKGRILVNCTDIREFDIGTFLAKVGYVSQDTFIYNASIRDNIAFGNKYSEEQVILAAQRANIHSFIASLPDGYDSMVGDQGLKLSGGEKQRIAIARALVRDPEILVLDEATSNLDNESEAIVQESINRVAETVTTFIVAHRLSTIRRADVIYVMSRGRIVEYGSHENLMEMHGRYYELYERSG
ncbi:Vitamin B12 import ATP-binding protein BtuD [anaerobic digester metagenome]